MLQSLLTSRVRAKLLTLLFMHPENDYYLKGLVRDLDENNNAVRRELNQLEHMGLVRSQVRGKTKLYRVNPGHPVFPDLRGLVVKTSGLGDTIREGLAAVGGIEQAFIYGSFASGQEDARSDVDLLIVGQVDMEALRQVLRDLEGRLGREINDSVYDPEEFRQRRAEGDAFLSRVWAGPRIALVGDGDAVA